MNVLEKEMIEILKVLKSEFGVSEIKAEFEAEGSRMEELMRLKDVASAVGLSIILKIGGVEAITDIYNGLAIGVKGIIAPMVETPFALQKFLNTIKNYIAEDNAQDIDFAFNLETITGYENCDKILSLLDLPCIAGVTVGRVDLTASLGYDRSMVDSDFIFEICKNIFTKVKAKKLRTTLGGAISKSSEDFIKRLTDLKTLDKFETRKVVFPAQAIRHSGQAIKKALEFELSWLKSKRRYYSRVKSEDENRILILEKRLQEI